LRSRDTRLSAGARKRYDQEQRQADHVSRYLSIINSVSSPREFAVK